MGCIAKADAQIRLMAKPGDIVISRDNDFLIWGCETAWLLLEVNVALEVNVHDAVIRRGESLRIGQLRTIAVACAGPVVVE